WESLMRRMLKVKVEQADGWSGREYHRHLKAKKIRLERRKAKKDPACVPTYGKYSGYET
ncbi:MAG: hypothetical protein GTO02_05510, partial [Candidatus Dadabacteria bacterium]|nr:hypothetical protein [Candidatus Dadabacteria bacterium]